MNYFFVNTTTIQESVYFSQKQSDVMTTSVESDTGIINPNVRDKSSNNAIGLVHGICLSTQDIENIRTFVQDFALKALLPYFERQIFQLQEAVCFHIETIIIGFEHYHFQSIYLFRFPIKKV